MKINKSYKYRIYPNVKQKILIAKTFGCVRMYWNLSVAEFNKHSIEYNPKYLTAKQFRDEYEFPKEVSHGAIQQKKRDFEKAKAQYFNKKRKKSLGRMKFKSRHKSKDSFRMTNNKFKFKKGKLKIEKLGLIKFDNHRPLPEDCKLMSVTVSKDRCGDYFASINFELEIQAKKKVINDNVGIDLGLSSIATLSNGMQFGNPKRFRESQSKLKRAQQHLSRKKKGSGRYLKQKLKVAKIHRKISRQREWHLHNISRYIVDNFNEIGMEDLNVQGMMKNRKLAKSLADSSMSMLKTMIQYKQKEYGKEVVQIGRFEASTKECHVCKHTQDMKLSDRIFECGNCGLTMDRDVQAARVIRNKSVGVNADYNRTRSNSKTLHPLVVVKRIA